jgi:calcium/calmodulin-dependent protein kinase (CaM kinase) II
MGNMVETELLKLNQQLLDSIARADWKTYQELCDPSLTCFEPEALGQLVEGMEFHRFYFQLPAAVAPCTTTMASPHVRVMGDVAVISYVRLNQRIGADGSPLTRAVEETRVWQKQNGVWKHVHFHRSIPEGESR